MYAMVKTVKDKISVVFCLELQDPK